MSRNRCFLSTIDLSINLILPKRHQILDLYMLKTYPLAELKKSQMQRAQKATLEDTEERAWTFLYEVGVQDDAGTAHTVTDMGRESNVSMPTVVQSGEVASAPG